MFPPDPRRKNKLCKFHFSATKVGCRTSHRFSCGGSRICAQLSRGGSCSMLALRWNSERVGERRMLLRSFPTLSQKTRKDGATGKVPPFRKRTRKDGARA